MNINNSKMLQIKPFVEKDFERLINWIPNQRFLTQWAGPFFYYPLNKRQLFNYLKETNVDKPEKFIFKVLDNKKQKTIGHIEIGYINYNKLEAALCRVLIGDADYKNKGYGLEMTELAMSYAFQKIGLNRIVLGVYDFNTPAIRCYQKAGFETYEIRKKLPVPGNEFWNLICMESKRENWENRLIEKNLDAVAV